MNQVKKLKNLYKLSYFNKLAINQFCNISNKNLYSNINRWLKQGDLVQLKKGLYVTREYLLRLHERDIYLEFLANKLREPSYLSLEYILHKHSILTEAVYAYTSITAKVKRIYQNPLGTFIYRNMKDVLFTGYSIISEGGFKIKQATRAKALFDYLYFKTWSQARIDHATVASFRLNLEEISDRDLKELARYCKLAGTKKLQELPNILRDIRDT